MNYIYINIYKCRWYIELHIYKYIYIYSERVGQLALNFKMLFNTKIYKKINRKNK